MNAGAESLAFVLRPQEGPASLIGIRWTVGDFSKLNTTKHYSDTVEVSGYKWRVLLFPKGNNADHLSVYLSVADLDNLSNGWSKYMQFSLSLINQVYPQNTAQKDTQHTFTAQESDWGFMSLTSLSDLHDPSKGFIVNDKIIVEVALDVPNVLKKETSYVGLENQGATSYMNSLLQTMYHIPYFRKAVYRMPTRENDVPSRSIPLALQSLFYKLQYSDTTVATKELIESFRWNACESFMQNDVQELNRVLCEKLEDEMKGTVVEGTMQQLFEGHHMNYIECINVNSKSMRKETFYDLQLDVRGCRDVYASFDKYVNVERLDGDNMYRTEKHGLQDARKGILFVDFPPVLQLQLKRFEYDFVQETMVKINDRYEFPLELDLDQENGKYLSPDADKRVRNLFTLHSVLVHSGGEHGGRYHTFSRPTLSDQWFKFDDEQVTKEDTKVSIMEQYGGVEETNPEFNDTSTELTKFSNAYMLVYIRKKDVDKIMCNVGEQDITENLRLRLKKEVEEKERNKKEAHLYTIIKVARDGDLAKQIGREIHFDLVDHDKVRYFRVPKEALFYKFKEFVAKEFGIQVQFLRFWLWVKRHNQTYRPHRPLRPEEEAQAVGQLGEVSKAHSTVLNLFLEVDLGLNLRPIQLPEKTEDDIILFFKLYDPVKEELRYAGRLFVKTSTRPSEIFKKLNDMVGYSSCQELELYEEITFEPLVMSDPMDKKLSFQASQLEDGDIICFQKSLPVQSRQQYRYPTVPSYLKYIKNRQVVIFRSLKNPKEEPLHLELSKLSIYDEVVEQLARQLSVHDISKIRVTPNNRYSKQFKPTDNLSDMLVHCNQTSDILYYEVLKTQAGPSNSASQLNKPSSCVICLDAPVEAACIPCGHMAGCSTCLNKVKDKNWGCPICRVKIQQVVRIYTV